MIKLVIYDRVYYFDYAICLKKFIEEKYRERSFGGKEIGFIVY